MQLYFTHLRRFRHEAWLFLVALTIFAFATAVPGVFFNLYLQALDFDRTFIGITTAASQLGGAIASIPAAALLDIIGRRRAMIIGAAASLASAAVTLLVIDARLIIIIQFLSGFGAVLYALAVIPLLAELSTPHERTTLFSMSEGLSTLALFFGSVVAGPLPGLVAPLLNSGPESADAYRAVMLASLAVRCLGILPLALIHDSAGAIAAENAPSGGTRRRTLSYFDPRVLLRLQTPIWKYALPVLITYFGGSLIFPFLNIYLKQRFAVDDATLGVVFGAINLAIGVCALLGPLAANALGRVRVVIWGAFFSAACLAIVGYGSIFGLVAAVIVIRSGLFNMTLPLYRAYIIDHTPPHEYAVVNLIYSTAANVGPTIAPPLSGLVQDRLGFTPLFGIAIGLYALAGVAYHYVSRSKRQS
ncbi:MAG: MFS transporter [Chloroflexi bacterium]|nr:MFS transporter [Chloroflexota bacterium]